MQESQNCAECVDIGAMEFDKLADFAKENQIDLTIVGMDDPLVGGIVDVFEAKRTGSVRTKEECCNPGRLQGIFQRI